MSRRSARPATGTRTSVTISSGSSAVVNVPCRNSSIGTVRVPDELATTTSAPRASITDPQSPAGSACASDPASVPRLRTTGSEISGAAAAITGYRDFRRSDAASWLLRASAPTRRWPSASSMWSRPGIRLMSTISAGVANRSFISGIRLWPPARTFASSPCSASSESASSSDAGAAYSKLAGNITLLSRNAFLDGAYTPRSGGSSYPLSEG